MAAAPEKIHEQIKPDAEQQEHQPGMEFDMVS